MSFRGYFLSSHRIHLKISKQSAFVGFPPPLLGEQALRLPVLSNGVHYLGLNKPGGIAVREHPWWNFPDLDTALNKQLESEKPELLRLKASVFGSIYNLEPEISGIVLYAKDRDGLEHLRNEFGSAKMAFRFLFIAPTFSGECEEGFQADAPLLPHNTKPKIIPSSAKGKKATSLFHRLETADSGWSLWEAQVNYFRVHQVRAHFALGGSAILGDLLYGEVEPPLVRDLVATKRGGPRLHIPAFKGLALHLSDLSFTAQTGEAVSMHAPLPNAFTVFLKRAGFGLAYTSR